MMRKYFFGVLMLALTFIVSACAPAQQESAAPVNSSLTFEQVSATGLSPYLHLTLSPHFDGTKQKWVYDLRVENISEQPVTGIQLVKPSFNSARQELGPHESYSSLGIVLSDDPELVIEINYLVDGMPHHGNMQYRITTKNKVP